MNHANPPEQPHAAPTGSPLRTWLKSGAIVLLLLVVSALLLAPWLIDSETISRAVRDEVTAATKGRVVYRELDLSYLPRPAIELQQVTLAIPGQAQGTIETLRVTPEFFALLKGELRLSRIELKAPVLTLEWPETPPGQAAAPQPLLAALKERLPAVLQPLSTMAPGLRLRIRDGRLSVMRGKQQRVEADELNLRLRLATADPHTARATLQGQLSKLSIHHKGGVETIGGLDLEGSAELANGEIRVALERLAATDPGLELAGNLDLVAASPPIALQLTGSGIDVDATRRVALALAGDTTPTKEIFDYLRGGRVPQISFSTHGESLTDLGDLDNILIQGELQDGKVSIPEIRLELTEVVGDVLISKGVLQGTRLSTRLEGSTGRDGTLKVGLAEGNDLFQLGLTLSANLAETQPILQRVVGDPDFVAELGKISNLQGTGHGRLTLGDSLDDINARVEVRELQLSADYQRIPFPIAIDQGTFTFGRGEVELGKLSGKLGRSQFSDLSCQLHLQEDRLDIRSGRFGLDMAELYPWLAAQEGLREPLAPVRAVEGRLDVSALTLKGVIDEPATWQFAATGTLQDLGIDTDPFPVALARGTFAVSKEEIELGQLSGKLGQSQFSDLSGRLGLQTGRLDIRSGRFGLDMAELYPWLAARDGLREHLATVRAMNGQLDISALTLEGEIDNPGAWQFAISGAPQGLSIDTELLPDTLTFASGAFQADPRELSFEKLQAASLDAALTLSGSLKGLPEQLDRVELLLDGRMGPESVAWLSDKLDVAEAFAVQAPLDIVSAQLSWQPDGTTTFRGAVTIDQGPVLTADIGYRPEQLQIHQLAIKDQHSDASMTIDLATVQHDFKFAGRLAHESLNALFLNRQFASGLLAGEIAVSVPQAGKAGPTAQGQLTGEQLSIPTAAGERVDLEQLTLSADGSQVQVDITKLNWEGLIWTPVRAAVSFHQDRIDIGLAEARMCGIDAPGVISVTGSRFSLDMTLEGKALDVETSYTCLTEGRVKMTGTLDFSSQVTARGEAGELLKSLQGPLKMTFSNGVIEQSKALARTLEVLNVTEIVKGRLPNLRSTGFPYTTSTVEGEFKDGKLSIQRFFMDGETLDLLGYGTIDLEEGTIDAQLLAAPFKTVDTVVRNIPGVNYILAGTLVTIPVSVEGPLTDPKVRVMSASSVGKSLYKLGERTIKAPLRLIETILPGKGDASK